eukprot:m.48434 g.48434  ORF g.48434 m.48434 type:complete len:230 (+) comp14958_c0_seq4:30-719(+)
MRCPVLFLAAVAAAVAVAAAESDVITLSNEDFEHNTQASTGSTTGPWFIKMYAPWCGHCRSMAPAWDELASRLKGRVNVAKVDCTKERAVCSRFSVRGFPTLFLLRNNKLYPYSGQRTADALEEFALRTYKDATAQDVPSEPSAIWTAAANLESFLENIQLHSNPLVNAGIVGLGLSVAIALPLLLVLLLCAGRSAPEEEEEVTPAAAGSDASAPAADAAQQVENKKDQ